MNQVYRILNSHKVAKSFAARTSIPYCWPTSVFLETTNKCNLHCPLCPTGSGVMNREEGFVNLEIAEQVFSETSGYIEEMVLSFYGESLLHPHIVALIRLGKSYHHTIKMFSNLNISPKEGWREFVNTGIDHIFVSLDGMDQAVYSSYRVGGDFNKVISNIKSILKIREEENLSTPIIELQMLALKANELQWMRYVNLCKDLGADVVKLKYVNLGNEPTQVLADKFLPQNHEYHYYTKTRNPRLRQKLLNKTHEAFCKELYWGPAIISWNGDYILCCRDYNGDVKLDSIKSKTIWDFWNGEKISIIRERMKNPAFRYKMCHTCPALYFKNYVIERISINEQNSYSVPYKCKPYNQEFILPKSFDKEHDIKFYCNDNEDINFLHSLDLLESKKRQFQKGDIIDYGSYRTFTV